MSKVVHFVRHGKYDQASGSLIELGREQSARAARLLRDKALGTSAIVLTSDARRAVQTAEIIARGLELPIVESALFNDVGNDPYHLQSLDEALAEALASVPATIDDVSGLVVVSHEPLIGMVKGRGQEFEVANGEIVDYSPGSWTNPYL